MTTVCSRHVASGNIAIEPPAAFLATVLRDHLDVIATALLHLATPRRGVDTVADVLNKLMCNGTLVKFVDAARAALL